jgi:(1->4)-alpha-D-glucan 1-alpha-D-glucosylmutase
MRPRATYRVQLHEGFPFAAAAEIAPYLRDLGISHLYTSPILTARAGSMHGYDVVDHTKINPELGGEAGFERMVAALRDCGLGLIVDIVPNHMAVGGADNPWWLDVIEKGRQSPFAGFFDIDFDAAVPNLTGRVLAPFLGAPYEQELHSGDIAVIRDDALGKIAVAYHGHRFPIRPEDAADVSADLARYADPLQLHELLERQNFQLAWWRTAGDQINWRRFFDVTELAALRIEVPEVFEAVHAKIFDLYASGLIDGLRVDHVDGLADPAAYCRALRADLERLRAGRPERSAAYIVVEKILGADEDLPDDWPVDGTTGYDFMNQVSAVQHAPAGEERLTAFWTELSGRSALFEDEELAAREELLRTNFDNQLAATAACFVDIAQAAATRDLTLQSIQRALVHIIRHLRVYRTYATGLPGTPGPGAGFDAALAAAKEEAPAETLALDFIAAVMALPDARNAVRRFNQLTAPVAAKAVEDTAFYRYGRLLSRNDVGFEPGRLAIPIDKFHADMLRRRPGGMLGTATHDHKRGEDVRARLAVLSEESDRWCDTVRAWCDVNAPLRPEGLAADDEYQLYQTLVGIWPATGACRDPDQLQELCKRALAWRTKSLREAKLRSSWSQPNEAHEAFNRAFVEAILDPDRSQAFLAAIDDFVTAIAPAGALNGLVQTVLRLTVPGVPDTYQGAEFWDLSLVDPAARGADRRCTPRRFGDALAGRASEAGARRAPAGAAAGGTWPVCGGRLSSARGHRDARRSHHRVPARK